jgi:transposase
MGRPCKALQLSPSQLRDLEELSAQAKTFGVCDVVLRIRGLVMVARQYSYREVAACLGVTSGSVSNWVGHFERQGYEGLLTRPHPGRPAELLEEELLLLDDLIDAGAAASGFPNDLWDARRVAAVIRSHFGISYHPHHVAKLLRARGFSVQKPQRLLALADAAEQYRWETETKWEIERRAVRKTATVFFEDEMTLATQSTSGRTWSRVGRTPEHKIFGRHKGVKAFGAVSGSGLFRYRVQLSYFSQETFRAFLVAFRSSTDGYLILIIDGAPYHQGEAVTDFMQDPRNEMELYRLPSYSPELNPQEHVWKLFRKQYAHNRSFFSTSETLTAARSGFRSLQQSSGLQGIYLECQHYFE